MKFALGLKLPSHLPEGSMFSEFWEPLGSLVWVKNFTHLRGAIALLGDSALSLDIFNNQLCEMLDAAPKIRTPRVERQVRRGLRT